MGNLNHHPAKMLRALLDLARQVLISRLVHRWTQSSPRRDLLPILETLGIANLSEDGR